LTNGFDDRCGFVDNERDDHEIAKVNREANRLMNRRLKENPFPYRSSMSFVLKTTNIPQVIGKFISEKKGAACALGVLTLAAGGTWKQKCIKWGQLDHGYNNYPEETERTVRCPKCSQYINLMATLYHLNDVHGLSNFKIGEWLERRYNL